jgi:hypothetical protein
MIALLPRPCARWLVFLGGALCLAGGAVPVRAERLSPGFGPGQGYREEVKAEEDVGTLDPAAATRLLATVLVAPAGTQPTSSNSSSSSSNLSNVVKSPNGSSSTSGNNSSGSTSSSSDPTPHDSPEPASVLLASLGVALTGWGQRRRRQAV